MCSTALPATASLHDVQGVSNADGLGRLVFDSYTPLPRQKSADTENLVNYGNVDGCFLALIGFITILCLILHLQSSYKREIWQKHASAYVKPYNLSSFRSQPSS